MTETRTLTTETYCWTSGPTAISGACKKKRRSLLDGNMEIGDTERFIEVSSSFADVKEEEASPRTGRFFLFLQLTSTLTTTPYTSYTETRSYSVAGCTPSWHNQCWG